MPDARIQFNKFPRRNPLAKFLSAEDRLQGACISWLKMQHKDVLFCHPHNEGKRTPFERYRAVVVGIKDSAGVPDLLIFEARDVYNGLAIEFKVGDAESSKNQYEYLSRLTDRGWRTEVCRSIDQFINTVNIYLSL